MSRIQNALRCNSTKKTAIMNYGQYSKQKTYIIV